MNGRTTAKGTAPGRGPESGRCLGRAGFTLLELMLAVSILSMVSLITYMTFSSGTRAWRRGLALTDELHYGDFAIEQLSMALRSAYWQNGERDGFRHEDGGEGEGNSDVISWVKLGTSLIGDACPFSGSPHRIKFSVEDDEKGRKSVAIRAWSLLGQPEDFDPEKLPPIFLSRKVVGFNCRMMDPTGKKDAAGNIEWLDKWEQTNQLPRTVEITLYMEPLEPKEPAVEVKRIVELPTAPLSWNGGDPSGDNPRFRRKVQGGGNPGQGPGGLTDGIPTMR